MVRPAAGGSAILFPRENVTTHGKRGQSRATFERRPVMSTAAHIPDASPPSNKALRILFTDDVPELRDITRISLGREGHLVDCAADGDEALAKIIADPSRYDVLITDHHMPRMDGLTLVRGVRALPFPGKIIVFTSSLTAEVEAGYRSLNVDHIVTKPVPPSVFRELLHNL